MLGHLLTEFLNVPTVLLVKHGLEIRTLVTAIAPRAQASHTPQEAPNTVLHVQEALGRILPIQDVKPALQVILDILTPLDAQPAALESTTQTTNPLHVKHVLQESTRSAQQVHAPPVRLESINHQAGQTHVCRATLATTRQAQGCQYVLRVYQERTAASQSQLHALFVKSGSTCQPLVGFDVCRVITGIVQTSVIFFRTEVDTYQTLQEALGVLHVNQEVTGGTKPYASHVKREGM